MHAFSKQRLYELSLNSLVMLGLGDPQTDTRGFEKANRMAIDQQIVLLTSFNNFQKNDNFETMVC